MWSAWTERAGRAARLAPCHALWLGPDGLWDHGPLPGWRPWRPATASAAAVQRHASFDAWCQAHPGRACQLLLSGWLLHEVLLDNQLPLADDSARLAYARQLLQHYHGEAALHWPLAAWQAGGRHGVCALHACTLAALQASAAAAGVALRAVQPWWSRALAIAWQQMPALARADQARLLVVDGALVTQVDLSRGRVVQLLQRHLADAQPASLRAWQASLAPVACSMALGHGLAAPWQALDGDALQVPLPLHGPSPAALWATRAAAAPDQPTPARLATAA